MNFSEFKKLLGSDPLNREPETLRARASDPEFEQAAVEAEAFERKLESAAKLPVDEEALVAGILEARRRPARRLPPWMAIAAGVLLSLGVGFYIMKDGIIQPDSIEEYVEQHFNHDGERLLARASGVVAPESVNGIMDDWNLEAAPELLGRIAFIKRCSTMDGLGAHMIVQTEDGPVTVLVMPATTVTDRQVIEFGDMSARLVALEEGSAAIISRLDQPVSGLDSLIRGAIRHAG